MHARLIVLTLAAWTAACAPAPPVQPLPLPCPSSATAEIEGAPLAPSLTPEQRLAVDTAVIRAAGPVLGQALIRFTDVEVPAWGRRGWQRVEQTARECAARTS